MRGGDEVGHPWENYFVSERTKWRLVNEPETRDFFWRTTQRQEIDLVEETAQQGLRAFELKRDSQKAYRALPKTFRSAYPESVFYGISMANAAEFLI